MYFVVFGCTGYEVVYKGDESYNRVRPSNGLVPLSQVLRSELIHWRFLDTWGSVSPGEKKDICDFLCLRMPQGWLGRRLL